MSEERFELSLDEAGQLALSGGRSEWMIKNNTALEDEFVNQQIHKFMFETRRGLTHARAIHTAIRSQSANFVHSIEVTEDEDEIAAVVICVSKKTPNGQPIQKTSPLPENFERHLSDYLSAASSVLASSNIGHNSPSFGIGSSGNASYVKVKVRFSIQDGYTSGVRSVFPFGEQSYNSHFKNNRRGDTILSDIECLVDRMRRESDSGLTSLSPQRYSIQLHDTTHHGPKINKSANISTLQISHDSSAAVLICAVIRREERLQNGPKIRETLCVWTPESDEPKTQLRIHVSCSGLRASRSARLYKELIAN